MNMSYCRFRNTSIDLEDCCWALEDYEEISEEEMTFAESLYERCKRYIEAFENYTENEY